MPTNDAGFTIQRESILWILLNYQFHKRIVEIKEPKEKTKGDVDILVKFDKEPDYYFQVKSTETRPTPDMREVNKGVEQLMHHYHENYRPDFTTRYVLVLEGENKDQLIQGFSLPLRKDPDDFRGNAGQLVKWFSYLKNRNPEIEDAKIGSFLESFFVICTPDRKYFKPYLEEFLGKRSELDQICRDLEAGNPVTKSTFIGQFNKRVLGGKGVMEDESRDLHRDKNEDLLLKFGDDLLRYADYLAIIHNLRFFTGLEDSSEIDAKFGVECVAFFREQVKKLHQEKTSAMDSMRSFPSAILQGFGFYDTSQLDEFLSRSEKEIGKGRFTTYERIQLGLEVLGYAVERWESSENVLWKSWTDAVLLDIETSGLDKKKMNDLIDAFIGSNRREGMKNYYRSLSLNRKNLHIVLDNFFHGYEITRDVALDGLIASLKKNDWTIKKLIDALEACSAQKQAHIEGARDLVDACRIVLHKEHAEFR